MFRWKLDLTIDKKWVIFILLSIMPGMLISIVNHDTMWLTASFLAVCGVAPLTQSFNNGIIAICYAVLICGLAYLVKYLFITHNMSLMLVAMLCLALLSGAIDNIRERYRAFSLWLIIGAVYGGIKLSYKAISLEQLNAIIGLAILGIILVLFVIKLYKIKIEASDEGKPQHFIFNLKYVMPLLITVFIWMRFNIAEPQWLICSSLSVVYPDLESVYQKFLHRFLGVVFGVTIGFLITLIIPNSIWITYFCFILAMLSLRVFNDYFTSYFIRCLTIIVYAGNQSFVTAMDRFFNVIIGGVIGLTCTYLLIQLYKLILHKSN